MSSCPSPDCIFATSDLNLYFDFYHRSINDAFCGIVMQVYIDYVSQAFLFRLITASIWQLTGCQVQA